MDSTVIPVTDRLHPHHIRCDRAGCNKAAVVVIDDGCYDNAFCKLCSETYIALEGDNTPNCPHHCCNTPMSLHVDPCMHTVYYYDCNECGRTYYIDEPTQEEKQLATVS